MAVKHTPQGMLIDDELWVSPAEQPASPAPEEPAPEDIMKQEEPTLKPKRKKGKKWQEKLT